jgi:hypothetical protein
MSKLFRIEQNVQTGEITQIDLTESEIAELHKQDEIIKLEELKVLELEQQKAALLVKLGITADEAKLLIQ